MRGYRRRSRPVRSAAKRPAWRSGAHGAAGGADILASGNRRDSDFSDTVNAGYVLANLSGRTELGRGFELRGRIENLFATDYETAAGFNTPGRGLYIDVVYRRP